MTNPTFRIVTRDRMLLGETAVGLVGPIEMPARRDFVDALISIASDNPASRIAFGFDPPRRRWIRHDDDLAKWCDSLVVSADELRGLPSNELLRRCASILDGIRPIMFVIVGNYLLHVMDHAVGDGGIFLDRFSTVVQLASGREHVSATLTAGNERFPLFAATKETFTRDRRALPALFAARKADRQFPAETHRPEGLPWQPDMATVTKVAPTELLHSIQKWIKNNDRSISVSSILIALLRRSFELSNVALQRDTTMLFDLRRYLPASAELVRGNFISGVPLRITSPGDPKQIADAVRVQTASARPLAALYLGVIRRKLVERPRAESRQRPRDPRLNLVFNNLGVSRSFQRLPWLAEPAERAIHFLVQPGSAEHMTALVVVVGRVMYFTLSFHANVVTPAAVEKALSLLVDEGELLLRDL